MKQFYKIWIDPTDKRIVIHNCDKLPPENYICQAWSIQEANKILTSLNLYENGRDGETEQANPATNFIQSHENAAALYQEAFTAGRIEGLRKAIEIAQRIYPTEDDMEIAILKQLPEGSEGK